jgi:hypothetical protein
MIGHVPAFITGHIKITKKAGNQNHLNFACSRLRIASPGNIQIWFIMAVKSN